MVYDGAMKKSSGAVPGGRALVAAGTLVAVTAHADEHAARARLVWTTANGCVDAPTLRRETAASLGREVVTAPDPSADLVIRGTAHRAGPDTFEAIVTLEDARGVVVGTRTLTSTASSCGPLSDGLPLSLALMVDRSLLDAKLDIRIPDRPPAPPPPPVTPLPTPPSPSTSRAYELAVGGGARVGSLPSVTALVDMTVHVELGQHWSLFGGGTATLPSSVTTTNASNANATTWSWGGSLGACPVRLSWFEPCAGVFGGAIVAQGGGSLEPRRDTAAWLGVGPHLRAWLPLDPHGRWALAATVDAAPYLVRPSLVYSRPGVGDQDLARASVGYVDFGLSVVLRSR